MDVYVVVEFARFLAKQLEKRVNVSRHLRRCSIDFHAAAGGKENDFIEFPGQLQLVGATDQMGWVYSELLAQLDRSCLVA